MLANVSSPHPQPAGSILALSGYKKISRQPSRILNSKGFQELLAEINDNDILQRFYDILRDDDKRASIQAGVELLKLKDRYPAGKLKLGAIEQRDKVLLEDSI